MNVYLDDERQTPSGFVRVYTAKEAIDLLMGGQVTLISLDHDLGDPGVADGYSVVSWIEEAAALHGFSPPLMSVHSANPSGRARMVAGIRSIEKISGKILLIGS